MACDKQCKADVFAAFFDEGEYSALFAQGALEAAFGCAGGQPVYAVFQNGGWSHCTYVGNKKIWAYRYVGSDGDGCVANCDW